MNLEEFREHVRVLAAGRAYSVSCTTTETMQSDGGGMRTLSWHAWIDGHRSGVNGDVGALLRWLYEGNAAGLQLAIAPGMASVTVSDWSAQAPPQRMLREANSVVGDPKFCIDSNWGRTPLRPIPGSHVEGTENVAVATGSIADPACVATGLRRGDGGPNCTHVDTVSGMAGTDKEGRNVLTENCSACGSKRVTFLKWARPGWEPIEEAEWVRPPDLRGESQ